MWEAGIKLTAINSAETNAAYLIFSTDKKKVEVFVANNGTKEQSIVLKKKKNKYCNKTFTLLTEKGYILLKDNKEIYKSE